LFPPPPPILVPHACVAISRGRRPTTIPSVFLFLRPLFCFFFLFFYFFYFFYIFSFFFFFFCFFFACCCL
jgi:hypothetical protein